MTNRRWPTITFEESIDDVGKSGELGYGKVFDGPKNAVRQKSESSVRGTDVAQKNMLMRATHQWLLLNDRTRSRCSH